jgi:flagellar assembly factor FliW
MPRAFLRFAEFGIAGSIIAVFPRFDKFAMLIRQEQIVGGNLKVSTKAYGQIEVDELQRLVFPAGLLGFESLKDYVLLDAEQQPFYWLQSVESAATAFVLINPFLFRPDYELDVHDDEFLEIGLSSQKDALVFAIVTIPAEGPMTANLQGPLIMNRETRKGKQLILSDPRWKTKHDIMKELAQGGGPTRGSEGGYDSSNDPSKKAKC